MYTFELSSYVCRVERIKYTKILGDLIGFVKYVLFYETHESENAYLL